jgi:hypothetical protein
MMMMINSLMILPQDIQQTFLYEKKKYYMNLVKNQCHHTLHVRKCCVSLILFFLVKYLFVWHAHIVNRQQFSYPINLAGILMKISWLFKKTQMTFLLSNNHKHKRKKQFIVSMSNLIYHFCLIVTPSSSFFFYLSLSRHSFKKKIDNAYYSIEKISLNSFSFIHSSIVTT